MAEQGWPAADLERVSHCPVCGEAHRELLHRGLTDRVFGCAPGAWDLQRCTGCRSAFLDPRPTQASIHRAYRTYYTHVGIGEREEDGALTGRKRLQRVLANGYRNFRFGTAAQPTSRLGVVAAAVLPGLRELLDRELRHMPRRNGAARVLDVGFGSGAFLDAAARAGWTVSGADPDPVAVENARARGFHVREGGIEAFAGDAAVHGTFDVITLSHVLEHVPHPREVLGHALRLLRPGGVLWIDTPNLRSLGHLRFGADWLHLDPPRHLVLFHWDSLEGLLESAGFVGLKRHVYRRAPRDSFVASARMRAGLTPLGARNAGVAIALQAHAAALAGYAAARRSETITVTARRPDGS